MILIFILLYKNMIVSTLNAHIKHSFYKLNQYSKYIAKCA